MQGLSHLVADPWLCAESTANSLELDDEQAMEDGPALGPSTADVYDPADDMSGGHYRGRVGGRGRGGRGRSVCTPSSPHDAGLVQEAPLRHASKCANVPSCHAPKTIIEACVPC